MYVYVVLGRARRSPGAQHCRPLRQCLSLECVPWKHHPIGLIPYSWTYDLSGLIIQLDSYPCPGLITGLDS